MLLMVWLSMVVPLPNPGEETLLKILTVPRNYCYSSVPGFIQHGYG